jgi:uncharacterized SAM-binding protein YcdF (DUF218 family)
MQKPSETVQSITDFLFIGEEENCLGTADLVIVLGNDDIVDTVDDIVTLWRHGHIIPESTVVLSGNVGLLNQGKRPESIRMYEEAVKRGLPSDIFLLEQAASNCLLNFEFSKPLIERIKPLSAFDYILCIGKSFLMRRAKMSAVACGYPEEKLHFYGITQDNRRFIDKNTWFQSGDATKRVLEELKRIAEYSLKGDISL